MKCILDKLISEHASVEDSRYINNFVNCPLFSGRQICYWCCLHIRDIAEPLHRGDYSAAHPEYERIVPEQIDREWDDIWSVCSKCSR